MQENKDRALAPDGSAETLHASDQGAPLQPALARLSLAARCARRIALRNSEDNGPALWIGC